MIPEYSKDQLTAILREYGISEINEYKMVDSSHGEDDVRHNYIIDGRYVLRVNSAPVMTEQRLEELNPLIDRYNVFGIRAKHTCFMQKSSCSLAGPIQAPFRIF